MQFPVLNKLWFFSKSLHLIISTRNNLEVYLLKSILFWFYPLYSILIKFSYQFYCSMSESERLGKKKSIFKPKVIISDQICFSAAILLPS